ncbi:ribonuclease E inhibitor RraB [Microlunatus capsulatus]|uniref:Regulator of ribonuclease activity B domain-containing protein n=1 Tax=Microlunatus capsulatus TaxID=99117 RepID=A0ABS4ZAA8_9ACTN|nr:ribonuclease E inhibitor RraB [Microlunatus capsulatus]MBP2417984.1 hypothetical protein [Microlunatus capsulatus]
MDPRDLLEEQLASTAGTWEVMTSHGVRAGEERAVDHYFDAPDGDRAEALAAALRAAGGSAGVERHRSRVLRRTTGWAVTGSSAPFPLTLDSLRGWVTTMVETGAEHDCVFDGWGLSV